MQRFLTSVGLSILLTLSSACSASTPISTSTTISTSVPSATSTLEPTVTSTFTPIPSATLDLQYLTIGNIKNLKPDELNVYTISEITDREFLRADLDYGTSGYQPSCNSRNIVTNIKRQMAFVGGKIFQSIFTTYYSCQGGSYYLTDPKSEDISIIELTSGKEIWHLVGNANSGHINHVSLSPDGKVVFVSRRNKASLIFDLNGGQILSNYQIISDFTVWSADSKKIAIVVQGKDGDSINIYNNRGQLLSQFLIPFGENFPYGKNITSISWSLDGSQLAAGYWTGEIFLISTTDSDNKIVQLSQLKYDPFSPVKNDSDTVITISSPGNLGISKLSFSPNGNLIAGFEVDINGETYLRVWRISDGSEVYSWLFDSENEYPNLEVDLKWTSDGSVLAFNVLTSGGGKIYFIDTSLQERTALSIYTGHYDKVFQDNYELLKTGFRYNQQDFYLSPDDKGLFVVSDVFAVIDSHVYKLEIVLIEAYELSE